METAETVILERQNQFSYIKCLPSAKREARKFSPDLIHAHYLAGNGLMAAWSGIHPMVASVWGSDIDTSANNRAVNWIVKRVLKRCDYITVTSQFLKSKVEGRLNGLTRTIAVIPFGVVFPIENSSVPVSRPFRICYLKEHKPVYGVDILIKALSRVVKEAPDVYLTIAGKENDYTGNLKKLVAENNLEKQVSFAGRIGHKKVFDFIAEHHVMAMPSRFEGFGVAAAEAAACSRPVIASNIGGIPEIIIDGKTGILVPPDDEMALAEAILKLAKNIELCGKMGRAGYEFVRQHYQWDKSLDLMCELYERVIHDSRQS